MHDTTYPKMSWSVKTHLKSWRDTRTCKSKRPALIQVHSCWKCFVQISCSSKCKQKWCLSCLYLLSSSFITFPSAFNDNFQLFQWRISSLFDDSTFTKDNHNLPIDNHFFIRQRLEKNFFFTANFPIFLDNWNFLLVFLR